MRKIVKEFNVYKFEELPEEGKRKALSNYGDINTDYNWYEFTYDDAKNVGIKILGFDLHYREIKIELQDSTEDVIENILREHGTHCETYETAQAYKVKLKAVRDENEKNIPCTHDFDIGYDEVDKDFIEAIGKDYLSILEKEYEYLQSELAIIETLNSNDYEFTEDGKIYK